MSDIHDFCDLICQDARVFPQVIADSTFEVVLTEDKTTRSNVRIFGIPQDSIVFNLDDYFHEPTIFAGTHSERKRADYVIISNKGNQKHIVIIELKKTGDKKSDIKNQLRGGASFIYYCYGILKNFWPGSEFNPEDYKFHFVAIAKSNSMKIQKRKDSLPNTTIENCNFITGRKEIHYNSLIKS